MRVNESYNIIKDFQFWTKGISF